MVYEHNIHVDLRPSKECETRGAKLFIAGMSAVPLLSGLIGSQLYHNWVVLFVGFGLFLLFFIPSFYYFRKFEEKFARIESWYGNGALQQYEKIIMITDRRIFFKDLDIPSWRIDPLRANIWREKDVIACPIVALQVIYVGGSQHGLTKLRFCFTTTQGIVEVSPTTFGTISQLVCQINPDVVVAGENYVAA